MNFLHVNQAIPHAQIPCQVTPGKDLSWCWVRHPGAQGKEGLDIQMQVKQTIQATFQLIIA